MKKREVNEVIKTIRRMMVLIFTLTLCAGFMAGCGKKEEPVVAPPEEPEEFYEGEEYAEYEDEEYTEYEDYEDYEEEPEEIAEEEPTPEESDDTYFEDLSNDEIVELARKHSGAPIAELDQVMDNGNLYIHLYEDMEDHTATIDWYEIDPETLKGMNFEGEAVDLSAAGSLSDSSDAEVEEGEGVAIADGEYVTDDVYEGELSADGKTMTITTALYEFVNSPSASYPKRTYVITVADSCNCVEVQEEIKTSSFFDKMDLIRDFLEGNSGLPITLKFKDNELVEIMFSS